MIASDLLDRLAARWPIDQGWLSARECADAPGFGGRRRLDFAALGTWGQNALTLVGVEVKVDRGDWIRELQRWDKSDVFVAECNEFWFCASHGNVILETEIPAGCGLLLPRGEQLVAKVRPQRRTQDPSPAILSAFFAKIRKERQRERAERARFATFAGRPIGIDDLRRLAGKYDALVSRREAIEDQRARRRSDSVEWNLALRAVRALGHDVLGWRLNDSKASEAEQRQRRIQLIVNACAIVGTALRLGLEQLDYRKLGDQLAAQIAAALPPREEANDG